MHADYSYSRNSSLSSLAIHAASKLVGQRFVTSYQTMQQAQWLPTTALKQRMNANLALLLRHAADTVPFYREFYSRSGLRSNALQTTDDLKLLPVVSKTIFRDLGLEKFLATNLPDYRRLESTTSGSTGDPFTFYLDREAMPLVFSSHLFYDSWFGLHPFDRYIRVMAPPADIQHSQVHIPLAAKLRHSARSKLQEIYEYLTQERIDLWEIDASAAERIYERIEGFQPAYILGYTSSLCRMADLLLEKKLLLTRPMKGIVTIAEMLTPLRRLLIEEYFRGPIINRYGLREFKYWAAQNCPHSPETFHINTELVVPEVVRHDGTTAEPGELGRLVMTNLHNYVMPFIRYDTGDLAVLDSQACDCGRSFPRIRHLEGRAQEYLETPSGVIYASVLGHYLFVVHHYAEAVRHYQFLQNSPQQVRFLVVPGVKFTERTAMKLQNDLEQLLGPGIAVTIETVAEIPPEKSGKRPIIKRPA